MVEKSTESDPSTRPCAQLSMAKPNLLALPNETLDQIFTETFRPLQLNNPACQAFRPSGPMKYEQDFLSLRLVNKRLASVGARFLMYKAVIGSERDFQAESRSWEHLSGEMNTSEMLQTSTV